MLRDTTAGATCYNHERFQKKLGDRSPVEYRIAIAV
ncbi:IS3 family transposase [Paenibacillus sp. NPDC058071]